MDCCVTPVLDLDELEEHPQWMARGLVWRRQDESRGEFRVLAPPVPLTATPAALRTPPPRLGEHTDDILAALGYSAEERACMRAAGAVA